MRRFIFIASLASLTCLALGSAGPAAPAKPKPAAATQPAMRIGVYDSRCVALACFRTEENLKNINSLYAEAKAAEKAGDKATYERIKKQMEGRQERVHAQVFSDTPIGDLLADRGDMLARVAAKTGVTAIVPSADYLAAGVEPIDLTDALVAEFSPSDKTRKIIADAHRQKPVPIEDLAVIKD